MRAFVIAIAFVWLLSSVGPASRVEAQEGQTRRDAQGPVTVAVTLMPASTPGAPIRAKVALDTHSVALDGVVFEQAVMLRLPDGTEVSPSAVERASGGGHHREAVLIFSASSAPDLVRIIVRNVGGVPERIFAWAAQ